jgi:hypothetical protein
MFVSLFHIHVRKARSRLALGAWIVLVLGAKQWGEAWEYFESVWGLLGALRETNMDEVNLLSMPVQDRSLTWDVSHPVSVVHSH